MTPSSLEVHAMNSVVTAAPSNINHIGFRLSLEAVRESHGLDPGESFGEIFSLAVALEDRKST